MTNREVFKRYEEESWVVEENLHFLLQLFADKLGVRPSFNTVSFIKSFMNEETIMDTKWAEKAKQDRFQQEQAQQIVEKDDYIDGDFREIS